MLRLAEIIRSEKLTLSSKKPGKGRKWVQISEVYPNHAVLDVRIHRSI